MKNTFWKILQIILFPITIVYLFYIVTSAKGQTLLEFFISATLFFLIAYLDYLIAQKTGWSVIDKLNRTFNKLGAPFRKYTKPFMRIAITLGIVGLVGYIFLLGGLIYYNYYAPQAEQTAQNEEIEQPNILQLNIYSIELPPSWSVEQVSNQEFKLFRNETEVGFAKCPMPEKGFEAWSFIASNRIVKSDDVEYGIDYWRGTTLSEDNYDISLIFMHRGSFNEWYEDIESSCYMEFGHRVSDLEISRIFKAIELI